MKKEKKDEDGWIERKVTIRARRNGSWLQLEIGEVKLIAKEVMEFKERGVQMKKLEV